MPLKRFIRTFLSISKFIEILRSFRLVLEPKQVQRYPNIAGIADLPLLRTLLTIHQNSPELKFWEKTDSFVLVAHASLTASRTLLVV